MGSSRWRICFTMSAKAAKVKSFLAAKVTADQRRVDAGSFRDAAQTGCTKTVARKTCDRGGQQRVAGGVPPKERPCSRFHVASWLERSPNSRSISGFRRRPPGDRSLVSPVKRAPPRFDHSAKSGRAETMDSSTAWQSPSTVCLPMAKHRSGRSAGRSSSTRLSSPDPGAAVRFQAAVEEKLDRLSRPSLGLLF